MAEETVGSVSVDVRANLDAFNKGVQEAHDAANKLDTTLSSQVQNALETVEKQFSNLGAVGSAAFKDLEAAAKGSAEGMRAIQQAAEAVATGTGTATSFWPKELLTELRTLTAEAKKEAFSFQHVWEQSLDAARQSADAATKALEGMEAPAEESSKVILKLFDDMKAKAGELSDLLTQTSAGSNFDEATEKIQTLSKAYDSLANDAVRNFKDSLDTSSGSMTEAKQIMVNEIAPAIERIGNFLGHFSTTAKNAFDLLAETVRGVPSELLRAEEALVRLTESSADFNQQYKDYKKGLIEIQQVSEPLRGAITRVNTAQQAYIENVEKQIDTDIRFQGGTRVNIDVMGKLRDSFWHLAGAVGLGTSAAALFDRAIHYVIHTVTEGIHAFVAWEKQTAAVSRAMGNAGLDARFMNDQVLALGESLGDVSGARAAYATLLQFRTISKDIFPELIRLGKDLQIQAGATGHGMQNLGGIMQQLGRAIEDPASAMGRLNQSGIVLDPLTKTLIKHFTDMGDRSKATSLLVNSLQQQVGGMAEEIGKGAAGPLLKWEEQVEASKIATGGWFATLALGTGVLQYFTGILEKANAAAGAFGRERQLEALKEQLAAQQGIAQTLGYNKLLEEQIAGLERDIALSKESQKQLAVSAATEAQRRHEALGIVLSDEFAIKNATGEQREIEQQLVKLRREGLVVGKEEEASARRRLAIEYEFFAAKQRAAEFDALEYRITATKERAAGNFAAARRTELLAQISAIEATRNAEGKSASERIADQEKINKLWRLYYAQQEEGEARIYRGLTDTTEEIENQVRALGMGTVAARAYLKEQQLLAEAADAGLAVDPEKIHRLAMSWSEAEQGLRLYQQRLDLTFETQTLFFSDTEKRIADMNRAMWGEDWQSHMDDANSKLVRFNEYMKEVYDVTSGFAHTFVDGLKEGKSAVEALNDALKNLADRLIDMALDAAIQALFRSITQAAAAGAFGGAPTTGWEATVTPGAKGMALSYGALVPMASGGVVTQPTIFPMQGGAGLMGEAGAEAVLPLKRGPSGSLGVEASGMAPIVNVSIIEAPGKGGSINKTQSNDQLDIEVLVDQIGAKKMGQSGSSMNRMLAQMGVGFPGIKR